MEEPRSTLTPIDSEGKAIALLLPRDLKETGLLSTLEDADNADLLYWGQDDYTNELEGYDTIYRLVKKGYSFDSLEFEMVECYLDPEASNMYHYLSRSQLGNMESSLNSYYRISVELTTKLINDQAKTETRGYSSKLKALMSVINGKTLVLTEYEGAYGSDMIASGLDAAGIEAVIVGTDANSDVLYDGEVIILSKYLSRFDEYSLTGVDTVVVFDYGGDRNQYYLVDTLKSILKGMKLGGHKQATVGAKVYLLSACYSPSSILAGYRTSDQNNAALVSQILGQYNNQYQNLVVNSEPAYLIAGELVS